MVKRERIYQCRSKAHVPRSMVPEEDRQPCQRSWYQDEYDASSSLGVRSAPSVVPLHLQSHLDRATWARSGFLPVEADSGGVVTLKTFWRQSLQEHVDQGEAVGLLVSHNSRKRKKGRKGENKCLVDPTGPFAVLLFCSQIVLLTRSFYCVSADGGSRLEDGSKRADPCLLLLHLALNILQLYR